MAYVRSDSLSYTDYLAGNGKLGSGLGANKRVLIRAKISILAADVDGSNYVVGRIPSNARVVYQDAYIRATAITGGTDYDLGIFEVDEKADGTLGAVVDADRFSGPLDFSSGANLYALSAIGNSSLVGSAVWEQLGLSEDPKKEYLLVLTGNTVGTVDGTVYIELGYTV